MKKHIFISLLMILSMSKLTASVTKNDLNGEWRFKQSTSSTWLPATVPGQVHTDLLANGIIDDPFYGTNEKHLQWVGEKDWEYANTFTVDADLLANNNITLVMEGVDTYADVYVNDYLVSKCDNMFRTWRVDIKPYLKEGENNIRFYFHSVFKVDMPKYLEAPFRLQAWPNNDQNQVIWLSLYARKAGYNYGWDWGPRLITSGVWRDIYIETWNDLKIDGAQISTKSINGKNAKMNSRVNVVSESDTPAVCRIMNGTVKLAEKRVNLKQGSNEIDLDFDVKNAKLWWSNGLGDQNLYDFTVVVESGNTSDRQEITTGIRTIEVIREDDAQGRSLFVRLNGKDVFMKGANWIPLDNFPARVDDDWYDYIIGSAAEANMNMLRIWGGGIYENDVFYEMCDKYGILVWQDMMFACGMFPADQYYLDSVAEEVRDNVKRIRNHPSIALWNGNNENEISYFGWGWRGKYTEEEDRIYQANLHKLFYDVIPEAIYSMDDTRYYHPTSPNTGYNDIPHSMGDVHFWSVWKGGWVEEYLKPENIGRFMSEYGFQSYPDMFTINKYAEQHDLNLESEVMLAHQRAKNDNTLDPHFANKMMSMYMAKYFNVPADFDEFIYMSQLLQAEAVKVAIEAHRRAMPYCMGTLYWQINDCWPVASWSSIDYYGRWKALHYFSRDAFSEVLVSPYEDGDNIKIKVVSDRQKAMKATLNIEAMDLAGNILYKKEMPFNLPANSTADILAISNNELFAAQAKNEILIAASVTENGNELSSNIFYPSYSNEYVYADITPEVKIEAAEGGYVLKLKADGLVRGLYLSCDEESRFSHNYITLLPNKEYTVKVDSKLSAREFESKLKLTSLNSLRSVN